MQKVIIFLLCVFAMEKASGQNAGINTTNPDQSAALHVKETGNKGMLIPKPDTLPIASEGMLIYNTACKCLKFGNGASWISIIPVPSGTIIMWSGEVSNIPDGWVLCDGKRYNYAGDVVSTGGVQTPDLKGQFIAGYSKVGEGEYTSIGQRGGQKSVGLGINHLPEHTHSISSMHNHTISVSADHTHDFTLTDIVKGNGGFASGQTYQGISYATPKAAQKITSSATTSVVVYPNGTGVSLNSTGSGVATHENRPAYYTIAYIMKL